MMNMLEICEVDMDAAAKKMGSSVPHKKWLDAFVGSFEKLFKTENRMNAGRHKITTQLEPLCKFLVEKQLSKGSITNLSKIDIPAHKPPTRFKSVTKHVSCNTILDQINEEDKTPMGNQAESKSLFSNRVQETPEKNLDEIKIASQKA